MKSIRLQFASAIVAVEVVMLSLLVWSMLSILKTTYEERLEDSADNIAAQYVATAARYIFETDIPSLNEYTKQVASHEEFSFAQIFDRDGNLIYFYSESPFEPHTGDHDPHVAGENTLVISKEITMSGLDFGHADVGFSRNLLDRALAKARTLGISIALAEIGLSALVAFWLSTRLTKGLRLLADAANRFGAGAVDVKVDIASQDEVGATAKAFNGMVRHRKEFKEAFLKQEKTFRTLIENSTDIIMLVSRQGDISYVSDAVTRTLGRKPEDVVGLNLADCFDESCVKDILDLFKKMATEFGIERKTEIRLPHKDGHMVLLDIGIQNLTNDPDIGSYILHAWDITEQRETEEKLRQSVKMEAIGNLTGGVAHDFNNLLAVILGNLELLREQETSKENVELIDAGIAATLRGADLTKNMLSFARRARLEPKNLDLNSIVRNTKNWIGRTLPANIQVETSLLAGLWEVEADASSTESAILNLILNARNAMPDGGNLTIETANVRIDDEYIDTRGETIATGRYVMLAVSDTGLGMPPDVVDRIFEPFFTTKPVGSGSGLGLSMVMGFMKQSGGAVRVYSEPGVGTTFKLYFKAKIGKAASEDSETETVDLAAPDQERVLVVEDESGVLDVLVATLSKAGYSVLSASSGDEAFRLYAKELPFDILVTDIVMPGQLQGPTLATAFRERCPGLPVVFMSGYASESTVHGNGLRPEDIRLMKPVRRVELIKAVKQALAK